MPLHPGVGRSYIHVFPRSEFFSEIRDCYRSAAARMPWMSVEDLDLFHDGRMEWNDPAVVLIFWGRLPEVVPDRRAAGLAFRFTESVGDPELLADVQVELLRGFAARARVPDLLIAGNPSVADFWSQLCRTVAVAPIGYEPLMLGKPDWACEKRWDVSYRGHYVQRRTWLIRAIQKRFGRRFNWIHGFGLERKYQLDASLIDLYIGHSVEYGFPGMRLWQSMASAATLVTEHRDAWPAVAGRHYVEIPVADHDDQGGFLKTLEGVLSGERLEEISRRAHEELSVYTVDFCMEKFVVPATANLRG